MLRSANSSSELHTAEILKTDEDMQNYQLEILWTVKISDRAKSAKWKK